MLSLPGILRQGIKFFVFLFLITLLSVPVFATNYAVTSTGDFSIGGGVNNATGVISGGAGNGLVTLRSALFAADTTGGGPHTVILGSNTYTVSLGQIIFGTKPQNITIQGNGPTLTTISMTGSGTNQTRFFFINDDGLKINVVIAVTGIKFLNGYANIATDPYGGAAIVSGGGTGNSLTLTNCDFTNNVVPADPSVNGPGGAVNNIVSGDLTINNCTFTNNHNNDNEGGAVFFFLYNATVAGMNPHYAGHLTVTNSTFTGNTTKGKGGGLYFTSQGMGDAQVPSDFSVDIHNNTFTGNTAGEYGGAIGANNSFGAPIAQVKINYNRIVGNSSTLTALTSGLFFANSQGSVDAQNNWWGCNSNPVGVVSTAPCNQASGIGMAGGGILDADPWLQLKTAASPSSIVTNQTSSLTTSFLSNSAGTAVTVANISRLIGLPVTWSSLGGSLSAQQATIQAAGTATATYTEGIGVAGTHSATAVVDSAPASGSVNTAAITVNKANTTAAVTSNLSTATVTGQPYTVAYTVTGAFGNSPTAPTATGNVQVSDGTSTCTGTVGAGSCSLTSTTAGAKTITATYLLGDANFNASPASTGVAHTVNKANTTASIGTDTPDPSNVGQNVTVTYSVAVTSPGAGTPTGNVVVSDGATICTGTVAAGQCTGPMNTAGNRNLTATYQGDTNFNASPASANAPHVVGQVTWTGTSSTAFAANGNWDTGLAPGSGDTAIIPTGASNQPTISGAISLASLSVASGRTLTVNNSLTVTGTLTNSGTINGTGTIINNFSNAGTVAPGLSPGILTITGTYANPGTLNIEIGGTGGAGVNPNGHDQLLVSGAATLGGTLNVTLTNGFTPAAGNSFVILDAASSTGTFATTNLPNIAPNTWNVAYNNAAGTVTLTVMAPTAANVGVSGRVLNQDGRGVSGARVTLTDSGGNVVYAMTSSFGYFRFVNVAAGQTYVIAVTAKQYQFTPRVINVADELTGVDFIADP